MNSELSRYQSNTLSRICHSLLYAVLIYFLSSTAVIADTQKNNLPALDPNHSPIAAENLPLLYKRLVAAFDQQYEKHIQKNKNRNLADDYAVYYLRQELQALIDIWHATGKLTYLEQAKGLVNKAISDAQSNKRQLLWHNQTRGTWPCFLNKKIEKQTGGHSQICDFQGAAGFLMVANALKQANQDDFEKIADFVEENIVEKWLFYNPSISPEQLTGPMSDRYLLVVLDGGRDKREHFATICMDLHKLGHDKYPYKQWAESLTELYIGLRQDLRNPAPNVERLGVNAPSDWGVVPNKSTGGYVWHYIPNWRRRNNIAVLDTAHANRTVWLTAKAHYEGLVDKERIDGFVKTFKKQIWKPEKNPFYFANFIDGSDTPYYDSKYGELPPGYKGHVWFGWHRLAAYDEDIKNIFLSLAYDLTNDGPNMPHSQNKTMANAPLCLYAWAARLLASDGKPLLFP